MKVTVVLFLQMADRIVVRVALVVQPVTSPSNQLVTNSLLTLHFQASVVHLEPQRSKLRKRG